MKKITEIMECIKNHEHIVIKPIVKTPEEITLELLSAFSGIDIEISSKGIYSRTVYTRIVKAAKKLASANLFYLEGEETIDEKQYKIIQY